MDYETHIVVENDGRTLTSTPLTEAEAASSSPVGTTLLVHEVLKDAVFVESWDREEALGEKANAVDTSRGLAYFYYHRAELSKTTPKKDPTLWEHLDEEDGL